MLFRRALLQELISTAAGAFLILVGIVIAQRAGYSANLVLALVSTIFTIIYSTSFKSGLLKGKLARFNQATKKLHDNS